VRSFHTDAIASSISSFKLKSRSLRIPFNISKRQDSHSLMLGECDGWNDREKWSSQISTPLLIHCGITNHLYASKMSNVASDAVSLLLCDKAFMPSEKTHRTIPVSYVKYRFDSDVI
jgi:hypothetical protein